jgi:hypothetical protein
VCVCALYEYVFLLTKFQEKTDDDGVDRWQKQENVTFYICKREYYTKNENDENEKASVVSLVLHKYE